MALIEAIEALRTRPARRSKTARRNEAENAVRRLRAYRDCVGDTPDTSMITTLLGTIACAERALWLETGGRLGERYATPSNVATRLGLGRD
jgi:hypothetical protein